MMRVNHNVAAYVPMEHLQELSKFTYKVPKVTTSKVEGTLGSISPFFIDQKAYNPEDSLLTKCVKTVITAVKMLSYVQSETRALVALLPLTSKIKDEVTQQLESLTEEICEDYHQILDKLFLQECYQEHLKVLSGESLEIPHERLIADYMGAFEDTIKARNTGFLNGQRVSLDSQEVREALLTAKRKNLEALLSEFNGDGADTIEETQSRIDAIQITIDVLLESKRAKNEVLNELCEFISRPLEKFQS